MTVWRTIAVLAVTLLVPLAAFAAPAGKVVIAQGVDPTTLDMHHQAETPASVIGKHIFDMLVERDQSLKLVPALAAEMPKLVAPTTWEVKLRKGVKFHNGEDFNAESVKFSLERLAGGQGKLRGATTFAPIDRVEIVDPYTVKVHTKKPWPTFSTVMNFVSGAMYPPKAYKDKDIAYISKNPIGTGPYTFVRWQKDEEIVLEANAGYWRGAPKIKTVIFRPIPDNAARLQALQAGDIQGYDLVEPQDYETIESSGPQVPPFDGCPRARVTAAPPVARTFWRAPCEKNASHSPSGEKKGAVAFSVAGMATTSDWSSDRRKSCETPSRVPV